MREEGPPVGVKRAFAWSMVNNVLLRIGGFAAGIVVARLVAPEQFGVFAVALTVQTILAAFADLGLGADLIRNGRIRERAATATTVALVTTGLVAMSMAITAGPVSALLGSVEATPVVQVMALTLILNGLSLVPFSILQRDLRQKAVFGTEVVSFGVSNVVTIALLLLGFGAMALAIARVVSQVAVCVLQHMLTRVRPTLGFDREVARSLLLFGVPIAGANLLSWVVMNIDYMVVGSIAGATVLGFYLLAFNVSSWPMAALGQAIRSVALPAFSRLTGAQQVASLGSAVALAWSSALLVGILLASLAPAVVSLVYGGRWLPAADALAGLAYFGATRVVIDLLATFLIAAGATRAVLLVQVAWLIGLVPAMIIGTDRYGLAGAGWSHVVATIVVVLPAYLIALRSSGMRLGALAAPLLVPLVAAIPAIVLTIVVARSLADLPWLALLAGGAVGTVVYLAPLAIWLLRRYRDLRDGGLEAPDSRDPVLVATVQ